MLPSWCWCWCGGEARRPRRPPAAGAPAPVGRCRPDRQCQRQRHAEAAARQPNLPVHPAATSSGVGPPAWSLGPGLLSGGGPAMTLVGQVTPADGAPAGEGVREGARQRQCSSTRWWSSNRRASRVRWGAHHRPVGLTLGPAQQTGGQPFHQGQGPFGFAGRDACDRRTTRPPPSGRDHPQPAGPVSSNENRSHCAVDRSSIASACRSRRRPWSVTLKRAAAGRRVGVQS